MYMKVPLLPTGANYWTFTSSLTCTKYPRATNSVNVIVLVAEQFKHMLSFTIDWPVHKDLESKKVQADSQTLHPCVRTKHCRESGLACETTSGS